MFYCSVLVKQYYSAKHLVLPLQIFATFTFKTTFSKQLQRERSKSENTTAGEKKKEKKKKNTIILRKPLDNRNFFAKVCQNNFFAKVCQNNFFAKVCQILKHLVLPLQIFLMLFFIMFFSCYGKTRRIFKLPLRSRAEPALWPLHALCVFSRRPLFDPHENHKK